ncbi:MAG TPA: hypothetical protein VG448_03160 [Solirubrobacterales bacterium]|nr:hypothetical protein [Solirubrobacterales bacterium]
MRIRQGQRFFPLSGVNRRRFTVTRLDGEWVAIEREDGSKGRVSLDGLLACDAAGAGVNFRFHGWRRLPRGYRTDFKVLAVEPRAGRCVISLPEWDPGSQVEVPLSELPQGLGVVGAEGSCRADLTAKSKGELSLHGFSAAKPRGLSREGLRDHPDLLVQGQEYRRRQDRKKFRILEVDPDSPTVPAWSGRRVVRLEAGRLLAQGSDGRGLYYTYLGGGRAGARRRRGKASRRT